MSERVKPQGQERFQLLAQEAIGSIGDSLKSVEDKKKGVAQGIKQTAEELLEEIKKLGDLPVYLPLKISHSSPRQLFKEPDPTSYIVTLLNTETNELIETWAYVADTRFEGGVHTFGKGWSGRIPRYAALAKTKWSSPKSLDLLDWLELGQHVIKTLEVAGEKLSKKQQINLPVDHRFKRPLVPSIKLPSETEEEKQIRQQYALLDLDFNSDKEKILI